MKQVTIEPKALWLLPKEIELLLAVLEKARTKTVPVRGLASIIGRLKSLEAEFNDNALRLRELAKRERANGFWEGEMSNLKPESPVGSTVKKLKKEQRRRIKAVEQQIAALPAEDVKKILEGE